MGWIDEMLVGVPVNAVLRERLTLEAEKRSATLTESIALKSENTALRSENEVLKSQVINLRQEIQRRDDIIKEKESQAHNTPLHESKRKIIVAITSSEDQALMEHQLKESTKLDSTDFKYHLHELEENGYIENNCAYFLLTQKGRKLVLDTRLLQQQA